MSDEDRVAPELQSFTHVAPWYDALMIGVPYEQWVRYIEDLLVQFDLKPRTILDLACGTGRASRLLAQRGYEVTGVDGSAAMVAEAVRRTPPGEVEYFCARMEEFSLDQRFDLVVSLFDSLNYLTDPADLQRCFLRVAAHLEPGGLFIFDMNGEYAFEADLFTQESFGHKRPVEYSWKSHYDPASRICRVDMLFVVQNGDRREEFREVHVQRAYAVEEVNALLRSAGLDILATFDAYTTQPAKPKSDRVFWVARAPGDRPETP